METMRLLAEQHVDPRCDHTGAKLFWSAGPKSASLKAVYQFAAPDIQETMLQYHGLCNVQLNKASLNFINTIPSWVCRC